MKKVSNVCHQKNNFLMALHSSTEELGIAIIDTFDPKKTINSKIFPLGKQLSTKLISCIEQAIPSKDWRQLRRVAVATGPGSFTGTRLTVVFARTLAQQLNCQLDGISSFELMANRLYKQLKPEELKKSFWIIKELPRRGLVGAEYKVEASSGSLGSLELLEIQPPHLLKDNEKISTTIYAKDNVNQDVIKLLDICQKRYELDKKNRWEEVLPIYPTSPIGSIK